jgi:hypothetical protein
MTRPAKVLQPEIIIARSHPNGHTHRVDKRLLLTQEPKPSLADSQVIGNAAAGYILHYIILAHFQIVWVNLVKAGNPFSSSSRFLLLF